MGKEGMNDLISRSALIKHFGGHVRAAKDDRDFSALDTWRKALFDVQDAPAVDAEPARHGKWSKDRKIGDVWCCSECGFGQLVSASFMYKKGCIGHTDNRTRFCPNCGSKMDAEVKE